MKNSITRVHSKTPQVAVLDNRGLSVRDITYCRHPDSHQSTDERITHHQYNARSALTHSADPRQHKAGRANCIYVTNLAGQILRTQSVDSGTTVALNDAATRPFMTVTNIGSGKGGQDDASQAVTRIIQYEDRLLPGRPLSVTEQVSGEVTRVAERFVYAGQTQQEKDLNLAGQCFRHYDTTGVVQMDSVALTGITLSVTRRLLKDADNVDAVTDWQGMDPAVWDQRLAPMAEARTTLSTADSTGAALTTVDAANNVQRVAYDVAGLLAGSWLTQKDGQEQSIVASLTYSAAGQKLRETHGNGVVTTYTYEPETQRLTGIKTERLSGHVSGARVLQDLRYEYDPVGNVLSIRNDAEETRFWHNQKVLPENTYVYDSLYQLVSANGREMASAGRQGNNLPAFVAFDNAAYTRYTRTYTYDTAGNLTQIRHNAPATNNNYTTDITLSARSNRGVPSTLTTNPEDVDALFTAGGQQKQLQPGQPLIWTARNELLKVTPVVRDGAANDSEHYRYDGNNQRVLKIGTQQTKATTTTQRVLYLPGLELRTTASDRMVAESLQVICIGEAGRAQVRVLHWESGKPAGFNQDQVRYSYDNLIGSCGLELDGDGNVISQEEYYPFGGTAILTARSQVEADYKTARYSGKERDATGLYYYGYRYYQPWAGRWLSADPAGTVDGLNLYRMVRNNPGTFIDDDGRWPLRFFDKDYIGKMEVNGEKVAVRKSPWGNSYQIGEDSKLTFQQEGVTVNNKVVSFKRNNDHKAFSELYQRWQNNDVTLIRGISSSHFSWDDIIVNKIVYSEGDKDVPGATMGGSKSRWLPTALDDEQNRIMVAGIAQGNHTDTIKDAIRNQEENSNILAGAILTFKAGKEMKHNINFLYDGEIVLQGPVKYPDFKIDSIITGDLLSPINISNIENYDEVLPLSAPYLEPGATSEQVSVVQEIANKFLRNGKESLINIRRGNR
ncbi:RHS repeat-associated core domain-containing protein [Serratia quinivorans]|uniref:RHS repeat-associated core domain-containing protein n=1 Tax=Serratia quinivorans TaxID=137545 RepID=UPI0034C619FA